MEALSACNASVDLEAVLKIFQCQNPALLLEPYLNRFYSETDLTSKMPQFSNKSEQAIFYIQKHFQEDLSQESLAIQLGLTPTYFSNIFKTETGKSFPGYLAECRIHHAVSLILSGQEDNSLMQSLINPHFLFNCLNLLASCAIIENAPQVHQYCLQIADYLRSSLNYNGKNVSLKKEFSFIQQYAEIQKLRFGSRITFDFQCDTSCEDSIIPAIILQPLVENSLIHGVGDYLNNAVITVHAARSLDQKVLITVKDNGNGISPEQLEHIRQTLDTPFQAGQKGTGMRSVYYRLNYYFHGNITFEITSDKNSGTTLCISFPYQT